MIFNKSEQQEKKYLQKVLNIINETINNTDVAVQEHVDTLQEYKDYLWSNKDIDPHEIRSMRESILNHFAIGESVIDKRKRLGKLLDIPYFGRIDFQEKQINEQITPIYIGIHSFYDHKNNVNLIYDWRAPISSMFYDFQLGETSYNTLDSKIQGNISLKRQYHIRKGKMKYMIESSMTINDDILQKELGTNADDKMKNIVATIQREQNLIIRNDDAPVLIIQGVAGSGKTSIALHRIAYLLYAHKGNISSKNILIISPNKVFADYISNVLPELGEESVPEASMEQILSAILDNKYKYQSFFEQVAQLLDKPEKSLIDRIHYKSTFEFISLLDKFIVHIENNYFRAKDVKVTKFFTVPAEYIKEQFHRFHRYPVRQRFEVMTDYIVESIYIQYRITLITSERNILKKEIKNMFAGNNDLQVYRDFFQWIEAPNMCKIRKNHTLEYADLAPLAYLRISLEGLKANSHVKHLLVDEMQDYSPIQYKVLLKLFPCRMTILGDAHQSVNPFGSSTADMIRKALIRGKIMKLCRSYRSTYEITELAQKIRKNNELEVVERHGEKPEMFAYKDKENEYKGISTIIDKFNKSDYESLGIVCKNELQALELYEDIKGLNNDIYFLSSRSDTFVKGIIVTSTHMAKGLEFDEVIIPFANDKNYNSETDRNMLYIAVTRAMHRLSLTYYGRISKFISEI